MGFELERCLRVFACNVEVSPLGVRFAQGLDARIPAHKHALDNHEYTK